MSSEASKHNFKPIEHEIESLKEEGASFTKEDALRVAMGLTKRALKKKVPEAFRASKDPTGLPSVLSRSTSIGSTGSAGSVGAAGTKAEKKAMKKAAKKTAKKSAKKAAKLQKKQAKQRQQIFGLATFAFALVVGIVYKITSDV